MNAEKMKRWVLAMGIVLCTTLLSAQPQYADSLVREHLGRGVAVVKQEAGEAFVTWRYLDSDPADIAFDVYRDGNKITPRPVTDRTWYVDTSLPEGEVRYEVRPAKNGTDAPSGSYILPAHAPVGYIEIPLYCPQGGNTPDGRSYTYSAGDASIGDVDGDGEYEIVLKWDPSNARQRTRWIHGQCAFRLLSPHGRAPVAHRPWAQYSCWGALYAIYGI